MDPDADIGGVDFWGAEVPPGGKPYAVEVENEPPLYMMVHVTGCALGDNPKAGPHVLKALHNGKPIALATLEKGRTHQHPLDFGMSATTTFVNTGPGPVFISGYVTRSYQHMEGSSDDDEGEDEDDDEDGLEDSDAEPPRGALANGRAKGRKSPFVEDEAEETSEEEGSDQEMEEGDEGASSDDSGGEDDEGEEEEDEDEDDDEGEGGSSDEEGEEEDSEAPPEEHKAAGKRGGPAQPSTPQPAKRQKQAGGKPVPASAPPKAAQQKQPAAAGGGAKQQQQQQQQAGGGGGDAEKQYLASIVSLIKGEGKPVPLAVLGSKVKRPEGLKARAKAFVLAHGDKLVLDEKAQTVGLKK